MGFKASFLWKSSADSRILPDNVNEYLLNARNRRVSDSFPERVFKIRKILFYIIDSCPFCYEKCCVVSLPNASISANC